MKTSLCLTLLAISVVTNLSNVPAQAGVLTQTNSYNASSTANYLDGFALAPDASNLFNTSTLSSSGFNSFAGSNIAVLQAPNADVDWGRTFNGDAGASAVAAYGFTKWTLTVQLPTSALGYDITQINVLSSWDNSLLNHYQNYDLAYATVSDPTFTSLGNYDYETAPDQAQALKTSLTGAIPTGVTALQFSFYANGSGFAQATRKIEILGTAAVPEPSTYAMLALGLGVLFLGLRRRQASKL